MVSKSGKSIVFLVSKEDFNIGVSVFVDACYEGSNVPIFRLSINLDLFRLCLEIGEDPFSF